MFFHLVENGKLQNGIWKSIINCQHGACVVEKAVVKAVLREHFTTSGQPKWFYFDWWGICSSGILVARIVCWRLFLIFIYFFSFVAWRKAALLLYYFIAISPLFLSFSLSLVALCVRFSATFFVVFSDLKFCWVCKALWHFLCRILWPGFESRVLSIVQLSRTSPKVVLDDSPVVMRGSFFSW